MGFMETGENPDGRYTDNGHQIRGPLEPLLALMGEQASTKGLQPLGNRRVGRKATRRNPAWSGMLQGEHTETKIYEFYAARDGGVWQARGYVGSKDGAHTTPPTIVWEYYGCTLLPS